MNILIVENIWMGETKYGFFDKLLLNSFTILPTLYARKIDAITPKKHTVEIVNERNDIIDFNRKYDLVNINYTTSTVKRAYEISDEFRKRGISVVLSGVHASLMPKEAKEHSDSILLGWGELNWLDLLNDYEKNKLKSVYMHKSYDKNTRLPPINIELPAFVISGAIEATRGCPFSCDFCPETSITGGSEFYKRPVDEVIEEIKNMPYKFFTFYDTSMTIDPNYSKELFRKMIGLKKKFSCNGNVDVLANDIELVKLSRKAGCRSWLIGFESFSQGTLNSVNKITNKVEEYKKAVENVHNNKMIVVGDFMFGFDSDTKDVFDETIKQINFLRIDAADFCILTPFPGTPIYNKFEKEERILTKDWTQYTLKNPVFEPKNMTPEELLKGVRKMYYEYYSASNNIKRIFRSIRLGMLPFLLVFQRTFSAAMSHRKLFF
jgi:radical SAM superfamily enzyme YgiQ (UPF0313 family)